MERELELNKGDELVWRHDDGLRRGVVITDTDRAVLILVTTGDEDDGFLHRKHWLPRARIRRKTGRTRSLSNAKALRWSDPCADYYAEQRRKRMDRIWHIAA